MTAASKSKRKTIGVFIARVGRVLGAEFLAGVEDAAQAHDLNVIIFVGGQPTPIIRPNESKTSYGLYDLARNDNLSGLVLYSDLAHGLNQAQIKQFCDEFPNIPLVANALDVEGVTNLLADNVNGMRSMIRHLIEDHGYRRIAFIKGIKDHVESEQRFLAYTEELKAHNIPYDANLVVSGDFSQESGRAAIRTLLDERRIPFDAVASANDRMAFGVMEVLQSRGVKVPREVAVTGFDNVRESRSMVIPLTTVSHSLFDAGKMAVESLFGLIGGRTEVTQTLLPTELVVRWSCGCMPQSLAKATVAKEEVARTGRLENKRDAAVRNMLDTAGLRARDAENFKEAAGVAWDAFLQVLHRQTPADTFLLAIEQLIITLQAQSDDTAVWHNVISTLRRYALAGISEKDSALLAENLFQQARILVGEFSQRLQAYKRLELEQREEILQSFSFSMAPAMSLPEIGEAIQRNFAAMGLRRMYVMFYDDVARPQSALLPPSKNHRLFMQYENERLDLFAEHPRLATGQLIPNETGLQDHRYTSVIMPLTLAQSRFGFMWLEMGPDDWEVYVRVRNLLSSALLRTMLVDQREMAQKEVERLLDEVRERAEELDTLYQGEQENRKNAEALFKAARNLSTLLRIEEVPQQILEQLHHVLPYERGSLMMEEVGRTTRVMAQHGFPDDPRVQQLRVEITEGGVYDQISHSGEPILLDDVTKSEGWVQVDWLPLNHSWMGVPLFSKNKVIGMLSLTRQEVAAFSQDDMILASTFAMQAAIALENARLYDELTRFNELMERMVSQRVEELNSAYTTLEKLDKNKTSFIQVSAHELRTPITVMKGYLGMLRGNPAITQNEALVMAVDGVMKGTDRLHQIVNAMLDVAKLEGQTVVPKMEPTILGLVLQLIQKEYKKDLEERNIKLVVESGVSSLPALLLDPQLIQKAIDCVVVNAIKYTPDGGMVTISAEPAQDERMGKTLEIRVKDTGIGIDPANHKVIFEKLHQIGTVELHSSGRTKFKGGGPGLGLAIAAGIIKAHQGRIWVESSGYDETKLPGSTFFIRIPMHEA